MTTTPNFFQIANSELTQDAFIQWLLEWANPKYKESDSELHNAALAFVRLLLLPNDSKVNLQIASVECEAQKNNIDILALITDVDGNKYAVIIEDKTDTTVHDNQLVRYSKDVKKRYRDYELHCVYFKTGNESQHSLHKIEHDYQNEEWVKANHPIFKMVLRENILKVLGSFSPNNVIYNDFFKNQERIQNLTETYKRQDKIVGEWGNTAWQGFLMELENRLDMGWWDNTHRPIKKNAKGNVLSGWDFRLPRISVTKDESIRIYLYLCLNSLSIKAYCKFARQPKGFTNITEVNYQLANFGLKLYPNKCKKQKSETITLAAIQQIDGTSLIDENKIVDIDGVTKKLIQLQQFLPELSKYIMLD